MIGKYEDMLVSGRLDKINQTTTSMIAEAEELKYQLHYPFAAQNLNDRSRRAATARIERLWDHGVIPYEIETNFTGMFVL